MSKRYGQIVNVSNEQVGSALVADTAAGATQLIVRNAVDFDEDRGGKLWINGQVIAWTKADDDTGIITLNGTLAADADEGDQVSLYDPLRSVVVVEKTALVEVGEGKSDAIHATVAAHLVRKLPEGSRGDDGEAVVIERDEDGDWTVIDVLGLGDPTASDIQFEADDTYTISAADVTAGMAVLELTHRPEPEALTAYWEGAFQPPTEYTIDYDAQTVTFPLPSYVAAGDELWVHYAYIHGINPRDMTVPDLTLIGSTAVYGDLSQVAVPAGTQAGDLMVLCGKSITSNDGREYGSVDCLDPRLPVRYRDAEGRVGVWAGRATGSGAPVQVTSQAVGSPNAATWLLVVFRGGRPSTRQEVAFPPPAATPVPTIPGRAAVAVKWVSYSTTVGTINPPAGYTKAAEYGTSVKFQVSTWRDEAVADAGSPAGLSDFLTGVTVLRGILIMEVKA